MNNELNEELNDGESIAKQLVEHMLRMGAAGLEIPVEITEGIMDGTKVFVMIQTESAFEERKRFKAALDRIRDERSPMSDDSIEAHRISDNAGDHEAAAFAMESQYYAKIAEEALSPARKETRHHDE